MSKFNACIIETISTSFMGYFVFRKASFTRLCVLRVRVYIKGIWLVYGNDDRGHGLYG